MVALAGKAEGQYETQREVVGNFLSQRFSPESAAAAKKCFYFDMFVMKKYSHSSLQWLFLLKLKLFYFPTPL